MEMTEKSLTDNPTMSDTSRRTVIKGVAGIAGAAALSASLPRAFAQAAAAGLPLPADSGIKHVVVLMMENRSFDHMLGWVPGATGKQAGRSFTDNSGATFDSFHLSNTQNCGSADPDHGYTGGRTQLNGGAMDGFLKTQPVGDQFPIGYFSSADVPFYANAARYWTICDKYFCGILAPTWPNRFYMHSGQTDRLTTGGPTSQNGPPSAANGGGLLSTLPTIWDLIAAANPSGNPANGITGRYYFGDSDAAFTALWGGKFASISLPFSQFLSDAASGNLPSVAYVDPSFDGEGAGTANDDHPLADIRNGQVLMNTVYQALTKSPNWANTLFIINYDEWGGFADHVAPPLAPVGQLEGTTIDPEVGKSNVDFTDANGNFFAFLGFRTPCVLIGPRARRGSVAGNQYDPNSILNMITWQFGLPGLGIRAATSGNIATALNFSAPPNLSIPPLPNLPTFTGTSGFLFGQTCASNAAANMDFINKEHAEHFAASKTIKELMAANGFRTT
jgi:phospholipase C